MNTNHRYSGVGSMVPNNAVHVGSRGPDPLYKTQVYDAMSMD
jgi:hypothetical protein